MKRKLTKAEEAAYRDLVRAAKRLRRAQQRASQPGRATRQGVQHDG